MPHTALPAEKTKEENLFIMHTFMLSLENLGGAILLALCTQIIVHPKNNTHGTLFTPRSFRDDIVHSSTIIEKYRHYS